MSRRLVFGAVCAVALATFESPSAVSGLRFPTTAQAQLGVIAFQRACSDYLPQEVQVMWGEEESATNPRVLLPPVPGVPQQFPLDVSTSGPLTVLLNGLRAAAVDVVDGRLVPAATLADLRLPGINFASFARFSPAGDRLALVSNRILVIADIVVGADGRPASLTNPTEVVDLRTIGSPSDSSSGANVSSLSFSPDGTQIVVTSYGDLWLLTLGPDGHTLSPSSPPEPLTRTVQQSEMHAAFSPDGTRLAYVGGNQRYTIFTLNLATSEVIDVLAGSNRAEGPSYPAWSPDSQFLAFSARGARAPRQSPCSIFVNYDLYVASADGTGTLGFLTNTVGTGVETRTKWGG